MGFCSFCGSEFNESDDGPAFPRSLGGERTDGGAAKQMQHQVEVAIPSVRSDPITRPTHI
jgi:hypothetical protein